MAISEEHRELISRLLPVDVPEVPCSECVPAVDGMRVEHAAMCPVMISIETATTTDRIWFEEHPYADHYYRPITWGEAAELAVHDARVRALAERHPLEPVGRVRVERLADGMRFRRFDDVYFILARQWSKRDLTPPA